jgi:sporulation protein YlmC with PRC-barrel domain
MLNIPINAQVRCTDGQCGKSSHVIVDPVQDTVTHFVVKDSGLPDNPDRLVSVERIADIGDNVIYLDCTRAELGKMEPFTTTHYVQTEIPDYANTSLGADPYAYFAQPVVAYDKEYASVPEQHVPRDKLAVYRGMDVKTSEGKVGTVDRLVVDPDSGQISHLLMLKGHLWAKKDVAIPVDAIDMVYKDEVHLSIDKEAVGALPTVPLTKH